MRIAGQEVLRPAVEVRKIAAAAARDQYFFPNAIRPLKDRNASPPLAGFNCTHESGSTGSEDENIAFVSQGQAREYRRKVLRPRATCLAIVLISGANMILQIARNIVLFAGSGGPDG